MESLFIKFLIEHNLDFQRIIISIQSCNFLGIQQKTGKDKMTYSLACLLGCSSVTSIYNQLWRAKNSITFKKPTLLFCPFSAQPGLK